jgi:hypothetical protein
MTGRLLNYITFASAILAGCTLILYLTESHLNPWDHRISITPEFHVGVMHDFTRSSLAIFNSAEFGPIFNAVTGIADSEGKVHLVVAQDVGWQFGGIYYRYIQRRDGIIFWTLAVNVGYPLLLFTVLPAAWIYRCAKRQRGWDVPSPENPACAGPRKK